MLALATIGIGIQPNLAAAQASGTAEALEPIVVYDESELNPVPPRYAWEGNTVLQGVRVIDGLGNRPSRNQDLLIVDGKISAVSRSLTVPEGARTIDGSGLTVMPGLIDAHAHLYGGWRGGNANGMRPLTWKWQLLAYLYSGGHARIRDRQQSGRLRRGDLVAAGDMLGPDMTIVGPYFETAPVGAGDESVLLQTPDLGMIGARLQGLKDLYGVEMVKCHSGTNTQILRVLVAEAHARDMRVVCVS